jgi:hypothetical protein
MKKLVVTMILLLMAMGGNAMIETLSLEQLAHGADLVVSGRMVKVLPVEKQVDGVEVIANFFEIKECLKGDKAVGEKLKIKTLQGIEDNVAFVEGKSYLLFLRVVDNYYEVFNSPQGSWPVETDGSYSAMGHGRTIDQVKSALKSRPLKFQPEFKPLSL